MRIMVHEALYQAEGPKAEPSVGTCCEPEISRTTPLSQVTDGRRPCCPTGIGRLDRIGLDNEGGETNVKKAFWLAGAMALVLASPALAGDTVKVGFVSTFT